MKKKSIKKVVKNTRTKERAVSPVVATILLIMLVVIIAVIIVLWFKLFLKEAVVKEVDGNTKNIEDYCRGLNLKVIFNEIDKTYGVSNEGNVPIYGFRLKLSNSGDSSTEEVEGPLNPGFSMMFTGTTDSYESIKIIPVLLGTRESGTVPEPFVCPERDGVDVK
jgi:flagellin-like protein